MNIEEKYNELCNTPSDIYLHLPKLKEYAEKSESILELGVRYGVSTYALLMGKPKIMTSIDINFWSDWAPVQEAALKQGTNFSLIKADVLSIEAKPTHNYDLTFIDTQHNYNQLIQELNIFAPFTNKYIILHDTETFKEHGESYDGTPKRGLKYATDEYFGKHKEWELEYHSILNNGLSIYARK